MENNSTTLALIAILGTVITALFKLLSDNNKALNNLAEVNRTGNEEAKARNGHLGEQNIHIVELITQQNRDIANIQASGHVDSSAPRG
jgi:hypothetical protein